MDHVPSEANHTTEQSAKQIIDASAILQRHHYNLMAKSAEVRWAYTTISKEKDITSAQCLRVVASLASVNEPVNEFHTLLQSQSIPLPYIISHKRVTLVLI